MRTQTGGRPPGNSPVAARLFGFAYKNVPCVAVPLQSCEVQLGESELPDGAGSVTNWRSHVGWNLWRASYFVII